MLQRAVPENPDMVDSRVVLVETGVGRTVVGKGVDFDGHGVGIELPSRGVFGTIADLGPIDG